MFYSQFILAKKGPLGTIWIAAHLERKLRKNQVADTDIGVSVDSIIFPEVPIALRLSSHLLLGVVRIYSRKVNYLFDDCSEALLKIKQAFRSTAVDLPPEESTAPYHSITLPETFDLDDFELPDNEIFLGNYVDHHVSSREQITLQDTMEGVVYATSQFGLDERFGDGDASQIGLDLDEELFMDSVKSQVDKEVPNYSPNPQESTCNVTLLEMKDGIDEEMLETSEAMVIDFVDQVDVPVENTEYVDYAHAPSTPGLLQEPNLCGVQEALACDDRLEPEDHNMTYFMVEFGKVSVPNQLDRHCVGDNDSKWSSCNDIDNDHLTIGLENKQVKSELHSTVSAVGRHMPEDGIDELDGQAMKEMEDTRNDNVLNNKSAICVDQMDVDSTTVDRLNASLASGSCGCVNDVEIHSECCLVGGQVSHKMSSELEELVFPGKISDVLFPQESPMICEVGNSEVQYIHDPNHVMHKEKSSGEKPVLLACISLLNQHDTTSFGGEECHATDHMKPGLKKNELSEAVLCGEADCKISDEHLNNATSSDNPSVNVNSSANPELPAPERLLSVPYVFSSHNSSLVDFATPEKDIVLGNIDGSDASKATFGKKRNLAENSLIVHSLNSIESVGVARSKRTTEYIPDDDDLLSSILVGRTSSVLKMKPTPPVVENTSMKLPRSSVQASITKRKVLMDDTMVLHGDTIRQQLTSTKDIRRVRKKAPCTRPEISVIQRQFLEDDFFSETILSGTSGQLMVLQCETLNFSGVKVSEVCHENASSDIAKVSEPAGIPDMADIDVPPADTSIPTEKDQVEELNIESRDFQTMRHATVIADILELQTVPDQRQGEISKMEIERGNFELANLAAESTICGLGFSSACVRDNSFETESRLLMDRIDDSTRDINHEEGLGIDDLDRDDKSRDLFADCFEPTVSHATVIPEDGSKPKHLILGVINEGEVRYEDTGLDDEDPTSSCMNDEVAIFSCSSTLGPNGDIKNSSFGGGEHTGIPEYNELNTTDSVVYTVNHSTGEDNDNFENLTSGNDTEFLNVNDDEIVEDEQFAEETRFVENSGWSSRTRFYSIMKLYTIKRPLQWTTCWLENHAKKHPECSLKHWCLRRGIMCT